MRTWQLILVVLSSTFTLLVQSGVGGRRPSAFQPAEPVTDSQVSSIPSGAQAESNKGAGQVSFPNSGAAAAQPAFLHGLALLHDFEYERAAKEFRRAESIDPNFAMAFWGEAMTYNHPIWMQLDLPTARAVLARLDPTPAARLAKAPTEREKEYLRALDTLYGAGAKVERDFRYAEAMARLHARYPGDVNAAAFYALALLGTAHNGRDERVYMRAAAILVPLFYKHPENPGVMHYLIHSCDDPIHAPLALPAALAYSKVAPDAAHAQHMTSHIFLAMGMWDRVVSANETATGVVNRQRTAEGLDPSRCGHYNYWLEYGYLEQGRYRAAEQIVAGCRAEAEKPGTAERARGTADPDDSSLGSFVVMRTRYMVDTGDWNGPVSKWTINTDGALMPEFNQAFGTGLAAAESGNVATARNALGILDSLLPKLSGLFDLVGMTPGDPMRAVPGIERDELRAAISLAEGEGPQAIALAQRAAAAAEMLPYAFGPPYPDKPPFELLGDILLQEQQAKEAERAFQEALSRTPRRTQSLLGLLRASRESGDPAAPNGARYELRKIWHEADHPMPLVQ
jgi:tetratricopeptide (TPR) repeat protein